MGRWLCCLSSKRFLQRFERTLACQSPIAIGGVDQPSHLAQKRILIRIENAIGIGHPPQHLEISARSSRLSRSVISRVKG